MTVTLRKGGVSIDIPLKVTYDLLDEAEQATLADENEAATSTRTSGSSTRGPTTRLPWRAGDGGSADRAEVGGSHAHDPSLADLSMKSPENPDPEVAQTLERLLVDQEDGFTRKDAARLWRRGRSRTTCRR